MLSEEEDFLFFDGRPSYKDRMEKLKENRMKELFLYDVRKRVLFNSSIFIIPFFIF